MPERMEAAVIGAGHAGLAMSHVLAERGIEHVVIERGRVGERWRTERWDSLRLLTPNWATWLPGWRYTGPEPDGFMHREEVAAYLQAYAESFGAPVRAGVEVKAVEAGDSDDRYLVRTSTGDLEVRSVVLATGAFQAPNVPPVARSVPGDVLQLHSSDYRSPDQLPVGAALVVGTGASGQQIAEELIRAGRRVYLSVGRHRRVPRRYRGRDYFWWLENTGFYEKTADEVPLEQRRRGASPALTGAHGGMHDLDLRRLAADGVTLVGRVQEVAGRDLILGGDLAAAVAQGDQAYEQFVQWVEQRLDLPGEDVDGPEPMTRHPDPPELSEPLRSLDLDQAGISSVVWATGFRPSFADWLRIPVLDEEGHPVHHRGVTACPGVFFVGLHWLHRLRSAFIRGAEEDARYLGDRIAQRASEVSTA
jgi:putative flavoprotein involved in K+ transport